MKKNRIYFLLTGLLLLALACTPGNTYHKVADIPSFSWSRDHAIDFELRLKDTTAAYDLFVIIRHNSDYPFSNIWLELQTFFPDGDTATLRKQIMLADNDELRWKGDCMGDICVVKVPLLSSGHFSRKGDYRFRIAHIMRSNPLPGILNVGMDVRKMDAR